MRCDDSSAGNASRHWRALRAASCVAAIAFSLDAFAGQWPDFGPQVAREGAVVVSITTVTMERRAAVDDDQRVGARAWRAPDAGEPAVERRPVRGFASGVIISSDGHILTSAHAVRRLSESTVRLADGREFSGRLVGLDAFSDVALMKIDAGRLPVAPIGDPRTIAVGDWVSAIGAPFGLEASMTAGIVSARRTLPDTGGIAMIQTDVAVNPGSSGSPLFNLHGEVVGINSMVYTTSGGYQGVSFALPIDVAMNVAQQLREHGRVVRGQLGLGVQEVTPALANAFGLRRAAGAIVVSLTGGGPGERAGLRVGDIVVGIDDQLDLPCGVIQQRVADSAPGTSVRLAVWRSGTLQRLTVQVAGRESATPLPKPAALAGDRLGLVVGDAPARAIGADAAQVEVREAHGMALRAGLAAGDRILRINDAAISRVADYDLALARAPRDAYVAVLIVRDGRARYFALGDSALDP